MHYLVYTLLPVCYWRCELSVLAYNPSCHACLRAHIPAATVKDCYHFGTTSSKPTLLPASCLPHGVCHSNKKNQLIPSGWPHSTWPQLSDSAILRPGSDSCWFPWNSCAVRAKCRDYAAWLHIQWTVSRLLHLPESPQHLHPTLYRAPPQGPQTYLRRLC